MLVIASALSIQDVRERPKEAPERAAELHRRFDVEGSDLLSIVALWDYLRDRQRAALGQPVPPACAATSTSTTCACASGATCTASCVRWPGQLGIRAGVDDAHPDHVHRAVLAGLLSHLGMRDGESREFRGARDSRFVIAPGSVLTRRPPRWVMAARTGGDQPAVGAAGGGGATGVGRAARAAPRQAQLRRAVVGRARRAGRSRPRR